MNQNRQRPSSSNLFLSWITSKTTTQAPQEIDDELDRLAITRDSNDQRRLATAAPIITLTIQKNSL